MCSVDQRIDIKKFNWNIGDEEVLYLILHVNRLCSHEGVTSESA